MAGQVCMEEKDKAQGPLDSTVGGAGVVQAANAYAVRARDYYQRGLKENPLCVPLWLLVIRLEESVRGATKARSMTELARIKVTYPSLSLPLYLLDPTMEPYSSFPLLSCPLYVIIINKMPLEEEIWLESIRLERRAGNEKMAESLMAKVTTIAPFRS